MGPGSEMFKRSNPKAVQEGFLDHQEAKDMGKRCRALNEALETYPCHKMKLDPSRDGDIVDLGRALKSDLSEELDIPSHSLRVKVFADYDIRVGEGDHSGEDEGLGLEYATKVIEIPLCFQPKENATSPIYNITPSKLVLFRLGYKDEVVKRAAGLLGIGENASVGAIMNRGTIYPVVITRSPEEEVDKSGPVDEEQRDEPSYEPKTPMRAIVLDKNNPLHDEVFNEINKFVEQCAPKETKEKPDQGNSVKQEQ